MGPIRIVLADDHSLVLEAFRTMLATDQDVDVVATATNGRELIQAVKQHKPDIVVTDISMPTLNGIDACIRLRQVMPDIKVIFLTVKDDPDLIASLLRSGAKGYLLKSSAASELLQSIRAVASGSTYVTPLVTARMIGSLSSGEHVRPLDRLTVRQREVLQLLAEGKTMKHVASILSLTPRTVAFHKYRIMDTLGIESSAELVRFALESGLLDT
jgi:DNA-binding NarL/FixJ family response regulator